MRGYLGNQGRNRPNKGPRHGNRDGNRGNGGGRPDDMMHEPEVFEADDSEIISPAELTQSRSSMNLTELKLKPIHDLVKLAESMGLDSLARRLDGWGALGAVDRFNLDGLLALWHPAGTN